MTNQAQFVFICAKHFNEQKKVQSEFAMFKPKYLQVKTKLSVNYSIREKFVINDGDIKVNNINEVLGDSCQNSHLMNLYRI